MPSKTKSKLGLEFWRDAKSFIDACAYSLIAITIGLRDGEDARARALRPDSEWAPHIEWWFDLAITMKPIYDNVEPAARAVLVGMLVGAIKDWARDATKK